jgi:hypothetical protein
MRRIVAATGLVPVLVAPALADRDPAPAPVPVKTLPYEMEGTWCFAKEFEGAKSYVKCRASTNENDVEVTGTTIESAIADDAWHCTLSHMTWSASIYSAEAACEGEGYEATEGVKFYFDTDHRLVFVRDKDNMQQPRT